MKCAAPARATTRTDSRAGARGIAIRSGAPPATSEARDGRTPGGAGDAGMRGWGGGAEGGRQILLNHRTAPHRRGTAEEDH
eukprot:COSAG02_NODE_6413_length_3587_cov_7.371846_1_plen_81_part_00